MITKINKGNYILVKSDTGKLRVKGDDKIYSEATELLDKPREYEEVVDQPEESAEPEPAEETEESETINIL